MSDSEEGKLRFRMLTALSEMPTRPHSKHLRGLGHVMVSVLVHHNHKNKARNLTKGSSCGCGYKVWCTTGGHGMVADNWGENGVGICV